MRSRGEYDYASITAFNRAESLDSTEWPHAAGIWSNEHVAGWSHVTKAVHEAGGQIFAQLWHRQSNFVSFMDLRVTDDLVYTSSRPSLASRYA